MKKKNEVTIQAILHCMSHHDNFVVPIIALVVLVTRITDMSMRVCGDRLIEVIDQVLFSCWLDMQVK